VTRPADRDHPIWITAARKMSDIRLAERVSTLELERRTGICRARIRYYECGKLLLTLPTLRRIARALGRPVSEFVGD
jgi:transcriptional regulator with XRE-family HTH domain